ncbi:MAG: CsgG/HfaB family protein [Woeseiaceae bacterium]|nr:CsgG/HfaB family protein [Woeseiaceae bacterium]
MSDRNNAIAMTIMSAILIVVSSVLIPENTFGQNVLDATTGEIAVDAPGVFLKRKVGIARFSNETQSGTSFLVDDSGDRLGKQAADILSARLTETGKFLMFERLDADNVSAEQMLAGLKEEGVSIDFLIVGSVSEFGRSTESESGIFQRKKTQKAYSKVNVRLIDVATGRIVFATEGAGEATSEAKKTFGAGSSAGYDQSLTDKSMSEAISQLISNLVENMTSKPWRSYLLAEEGGAYIISGGPSQGLEVGAMLYVYENGRTIKNPQTGAMVMLPGKKVASVEILSSMGEDEFNELSFVSLTSGSITQPLENYYISDN